MKLFLLMALYTVTINVPIKYRSVTGHLSNDIGICTAVRIGTDKLLTAGHCVENASGQIVYTTATNEKGKAFVIKVNREMDLALLGTPNKTKSFAKLGEEPVMQTDKVFTVNSGEDQPLTYGEGFVQNVHKQDAEDRYALIADSIKVYQGASGSGLFNAKGDLVGINIIKTDAGSLAVPLDTIRGFICEPIAHKSR